MRERKGVYKSVREAAEEKVLKREKDFQIDIQSIVRRIRTEKKLSGVEVCRRAGDLDPRTLNALEKGRIKNPTVKTLHSVARGLGITISDLFRPTEALQEHYYCFGGPKGAFHMEFPKKGLKIVSFTPLIRDFFCGKLILAPKVKIKDPWEDHPFPVFISVLVGALEVTVEDQEKTALREGDNLFFRGIVKHSFQNLLHRETSILFLTAPSFLG